MDCRRCVTGSDYRYQDQILPVLWVAQRLVTLPAIIIPVRAKSSSLSCKATTARAKMDPADDRFVQMRIFNLFRIVDEASYLCGWADSDMRLFGCLAIWLTG